MTVVGGGRGLEASVGGRNLFARLRSHSIETRPRTRCTDYMGTTTTAGVAYGSLYCCICTRCTDYMGTTTTAGIPRAPQVKQQLTRAGDTAEFVSGVLRVNGLVHVRKLKPHTLLIDGTYNADFLRARRLIYTQFTAI